MFLEKRCLFSKVKQNFVNTLHFHKVCKLVQVSFFTSPHICHHLLLLFILADFTSGCTELLSFQLFWTPFMAVVVLYRLFFEQLFSLKDKS